MNITSQFSLLHYNGKASLNLMSIPTSFNNDNLLSAYYNNFINSISTIYDSQDSNGAIPVFWTELSGYNRIPSPDSTLTSLIPDKSYYVIALNDNVLPLQVPAVSGTLDTTSLTKPSPVIVWPTSDKLSADITLTGINNNYAYFSTTINNLIPNEVYQYVFSGIDANWPTVISPISGLLKPSKSSLDIESVLNFCPSSGGCESHPGLLSSTIENVAHYQYNDLFSILSLSVEPISYTGVEPVSDQLTVRCRNCLPAKPVYPIISFPCIVTGCSTNDHGSSSVMLSGVNNNYYYLKAHISGLIPGENYTYNVNDLAGNWPVVLYPTSGSINSTTNSADIEIIASFCATTGTCPPGTPGLITNYTLAQDFSRAYAHNNYFTMLNITLEQDDYPDITTTSNNISIRCSNCLPGNAILMNYPNTSFIGGGKQEYPTGCCSGSKPIIVSISDAVPGDKYEYVFSSPTNKISFSPSSGIAYFGSNGDGNINSIMTTNLSLDDQYVISFSLNNTIYDIPTLDFLTVKCGSGCNT
jgi:hypothetical protein